MSISVLILIVLAIAVAGYVMARRRAMALTGGDRRKLHSLIGYYGQTVFLFASVPALLFLGAWLFVQPIVIESRVSSFITPAD
ncbi:MAG: phosphate ABC transporter permease family protein, partial [Rhodobacteraceae bacterium]|nr:phosphate ABC transporter permease family protein [Paracoccaceae bacterium]